MRNGNQNADKSTKMGTKNAENFCHDSEVEIYKIEARFFQIRLTIRFFKNASQFVNQNP